MFERVCLIHYHEIGLKGRNRADFERRLQRNLDVALDRFPVRRAERIASRLVVSVEDPRRIGDVAEAIGRIPGVSSVSPAWKTARDMNEMEQAALIALRRADPAGTFKVDARRSNTDWPVSSMDMNVAIGAFLKDSTGLTVRLNDPDASVRVEVVQGDAYIYSEKLPGPGGLPVGTSGKIVSLLSAGIDSPVATWRMMRRGAVLVGVHFSGRPQTGDASERLVHEIATVLEETGGIGRIYVVPFGDLQKEIALAAPPDLRVLLYRRLMVRVAEAVAHEEGAKALVTGESLGQVASQTLTNIAAVDDSATMPVLRPLVGSDKLEIIADARRIGTFELSTQSHDDCCTLFMPRTPETHASVSAVRSAEEALDLDRMVDDALASISWRDYTCPSYKAPKRWRD
ncbi:MAG: tRNA 4-thiouridine(8) synthase ThiI [Coriobacteriales bacterium]|nr:tRNA 4-thiouridine(8) synthase ThiI [Coriobacteriales bacterium]